MLSTGTGVNNFYSVKLGNKLIGIVLEKMKGNAHFGQRLAKALLDKGYKSHRNSATGVEVTPLARAVDVTPSMIIRYLSGQSKPREDTLEAMAKWLGVTVSWLRDGIEISQLIEIPLLSWEEARDWKPETKSSNIHIMNLFIAISPSTFALEIKNDSSRPAFPPGTYIIIDPEEKIVHRSLVIAVEKGSKEVIFRQFLVENNDSYLKPLNAEFPAKLIDKSTKIKGVFVAADYTKAKF